MAASTSPATRSRVPVPAGQGDGPAHRVAHRRRTVRCRARRARRPRRRRSPRCGTPGGIRIPCPCPRWSRRDDTEVLAQRLVAGEPVEIGRRRPAVQQHDDRRIGVRPGQFADERGAPARAVRGAGPAAGPAPAPRSRPRAHDRFVWQGSAIQPCGRRSVVRSYPCDQAVLRSPDFMSAPASQTRSILRIFTLSAAPLGAEYSTVSPSALPTRAAPERRAGRDDVEAGAALLDRVDQVGLGHVLAVAVVEDRDDVADARRCRRRRRR